MFQATHQKYLARYAEPESQQLPELRARWDHALVIPACDEGSDLLRLLASARHAAGQTQVLTIIVVNGRENATTRVHEQNRACLNELMVHYPAYEASPGFWYHRNDGQDVLWIDRASPGRRLPPRQGVGLARKIGCDVAAALHAQGRIGSGWLTSTDADAILPASAFVDLPRSPRVSAITFPFQHQLEPPYDRAMALYEISLHHYVLGLEFARSPYAFHTIGSALGFSIDAYIAVRGFPKRQAGEDFYLLNKLAKVGKIERGSQAPIHLRGRPSERVPFGTGPAIRKIVEQDAYTLYHPAVFQELRTLVQSLHRFSIDGDPDALESANSTESWQALSALGIEPILQSLQSLAPKQRRHQLHGWFDGFRTMKWIHHRRNTTYPSLPWQECISVAPWFSEIPNDATPRDALHLTRAKMWGSPAEFLT